MVANGERVKEGGKLLTGRVAEGRYVTLEGSGRGSGIANVLVYFGQGKLCGGLGSHGLIFFEL